MIYPYSVSRCFGMYIINQKNARPKNHNTNTHTKSAHTFLFLYCFAASGKSLCIGCQWRQSVPLELWISRLWGKQNHTRKPKQTKEKKLAEKILTAGSEASKESIGIQLFERYRVYNFPQFPHCFPHFVFYICLSACRFVESNICRKFAHWFCLVDIKKRSFLTACVFW